MQAAVQMVARLRALSKLLADKGFPPTSAWWDEQLERFYRAQRRQQVLRCGRRGGKSTTLCRVAVCEALWGDHRIPPGDVGIVGIVSVSRDEASARLRTIKAILDALGAEYRERGETIELVSRPIVFKVFSASVAGVVGGTWVCALLDEVARWRDVDTGANPAKEVLASIRPTMATMPSAKLFMSSSPLGTEDAHAQAFALGDTDFQMVAYAPSWIANPTLTEEQTRALEPDERVWRREYLAEPQAGTIGAFDLVTVNRAIRELDEVNVIGRSVIVTDSSAGQGDAWVWGRVTYCETRTVEEERWLWHSARDGNGVITAKYGAVKRDAHGDPVPNPDYEPARRFLVVDGLGSLTGRFAVDVSADDVVDGLASFARDSNASMVVGDQYQQFFLSAGLARHRVAYTPMVWSADTKASAVARVRQWFREDSIVIEPGAEADALRRELLNFQERILPSGIVSYGARRGGHDDRVALLLNAAMADVAGLLHGSPLKKASGRYDW